MRIASLGDTFLISGPDTNNHLFVIISDPHKNPTEIVTVNFTSWEPGKDRSCIIQPGEHPWVTKESCVRYRQERLITLEEFNRCVKSQNINLQEPVSAALLRRIHAGARTSVHPSVRARQILTQQGHI